MSKELIGKKARILSLKGGSAYGFEVGDIVEITYNDFNSDNPNRIRFVNSYGSPGYLDIDKLQILDETPSNGILKVEFLGINIEGSVNDVLTLLKGLR